MAIFICGIFEVEEHLLLFNVIMRVLNSGRDRKSAREIAVALLSDILAIPAIAPSIAAIAVGHPPLLSLKLASMLSKIGSLKAQSDIVPKEIHSIDLDPSCPYQLAFHLDDGWSGVLNIYNLRVTHVHCPPPAWLTGASISSDLLYLRKPSWLPASSIYAVGSSYDTGIHILDFYPDTSSPSHVDYNEHAESLSEMNRQTKKNIFVPLSEGVTACASHPLNGTIIAGTKLDDDEPTEKIVSTSQYLKFDLGQYPDFDLGQYSDFDDFSEEETDLACNDFDIGQYPNFDDETAVAEEDVVDDNEEEVTIVYRGHEIMTDMNARFKISISYSQVWRAKCYALKLLRGSPKASFAQLPAYCHNLKLKNPGSVTHIKTDRDVRFELLFIAIGAAIRSFINCMRLIIIVDGAHLKGRYLGVNLLAVAMDANNEILSIAYGVGKSETSDSWTWFMGYFRDCIGPISNLTIISDRANSIDNVVRCFPDAFHGLCGVHLYKNIKSRPAGTLEHRVTPWTEKKITKRVVKSTSWRVEPCSNTLFKVLDNNLNGLVDLNAKTCSCMKWKTSGYLYDHVIKVSLHLNQDDSSAYAMDYYTTEVYRQTYGEIVYPIPHPSEWDIPDDLQTVLLPAMDRRLPGRPKSHDRIPSKGEEKKRSTCSRCKESGHTRLTCGSPVPSQSSFSLPKYGSSSKSQSQPASPFGTINLGDF
ncbi:Transducin/WD40 repeat-like superfamily protein, putative isoform 2 [Hibiscus syriacus]|uniref:Transducin/WD40 repeat-like superfamily protein, putative isoform 2 n=1 Tax=Hibiscus syriacus TaxID=106335 RepID=A0A6A2YU22_HIBSY|nr:Transducin/WD40 repeat-like superfamily protein, putative isoform 2 [Hibiscus syriacus]